jgi:hypothetical protein
MEGLGIDLDAHIGSHLEAGRLILDGINLVAQDNNRLLDALTNLKYPAGDKVFFRDAKSGRGHFVGNVSFLELLWKTELQGELPFWALDHVNFIIPSSPINFSRVGVSVDVAQFGRVNIALNGTCSTDGKMETAGTLTLGFKF